MRRLSEQDGPATQHGKELCLLALDGGGVRGLSELCILEELMRKIDSENPPNPYDCFDLIGGTSTGGLLAIMLGRLRMTIDECRQAYLGLAAEAFELRNHKAKPKWSAPWEWELNARFNTEALERGIKRIVVTALKRDPKNGMLSDFELENTLLKDVQSDCKIFVTATAESMPDRTTVLTSYRSERWPRDLLDSVTIWQAARATSAASTFFEPIRIGPYNEKFLDGATGANNPVNIVWDEAYDIWRPVGALENNVRCMVSVGTGVPTVTAFGSSLRNIGETLKNMSTETERTAEDFVRRYSRLHSEERYFRFNVLAGLEEVGLEEATKMDVIGQATRRYVTTEEQKKRLESCAKTLGRREWIRDVTNVCEAAFAEHKRAVATFASLERPYSSGTSQTTTWLENMPQVKAWTQDTFQPLCIFETPGLQMSGLVADIIRKRHIKEQPAPKVIYIDCSQHLTSHDQDTIWRSILRSLILQCIHHDPEAIERLQKRLVRTGHNLDDVFAKSVNGDVQSHFELLLNALRLVRPSKNDRTYVYIDNLDEVANAAGKIRLCDLTKWLTEVDHAVVSSRESEYVQEAVESDFHQEGIQTTFLVVSPDAEAKECYQSLHFPEWDDRRRIVDRPFRNTADWLWNDFAFLQWTRDHGILWIKGKPGSGKSTIARMITEEIADRLEKCGELALKVTTVPLATSTITGNFFYSTRMGAKATRHYYMLRSVLFQLLKHSATLYKHFRKVHRRILAAQTAWTVGDLMEIFETIMSDEIADGPTLICILDGFDEADDCQGCTEVPLGPDKAHFLSWLAVLSAKHSGNSKLRVIVLSRPHTDIDRALHQFPSIIVERNNGPAIETIVEAGMEDISKSIQSWNDRDCGSSTRGLPYSDQVHDITATLQHVQDRILEKANGTIQWVVTVINELKSQFARRGVYTRGELEAVVDSLPEGLDQLYQELVRRLQKRLALREFRKAKFMLTCVCFAQRPLTLQELREAIAMHNWNGLPIDNLQSHLKSQRVRLFQKGNWAPVEREVIDICGCLLEVIKRPRAPQDLEPGVEYWWTRPDDLVQVTHQTVQEFVMGTEQGVQTMRLSISLSMQLLSLNYTTYLACAASALMRILWHWELRDDICAGDKETIQLGKISQQICMMPLLVYIVSFFDVQCDVQMLQRLVEDKENEVIRVRNNFRSFFDDHMVPFFLEACRRSHLATIRLCFELRTSALDTKTIDLAGTQAIKDGNLTTLEALLDEGSYIHSWRGSDHGYDAVVEALLDDGSFMHSLRRSDYNYDAFFEAVRRDKVEVVQLLLWYCPWLIHCKNSQEWTALHFTAAMGYQDFASLLLRLGSAVDLKSTMERTPLMLACINANAPIVRLLLDAKCERNTYDAAGHTAMYYAIKQQDPCIIRMLLQDSILPGYLNGVIESIHDTYAKRFRHDARKARVHTRCSQHKPAGRRHSWPSSCYACATMALRQFESSAGFRCVSYHSRDTEEAMLHWRYVTVLQKTVDFFEPVREQGERVLSSSSRTLSSDESWPGNMLSHGPLLSRGASD